MMVFAETSIVAPTAPIAPPGDDRSDSADQGWFPSLDSDVYQPTSEEEAEAAQLLAESMAFEPLATHIKKCPRQRRSRLMTRPAPTYNDLTDADIYPHGVC